MELPELNQLLVLLINLGGALLGIAVYRHDPKRAVNRVFLLTIVLMLVWVNFAFVPRLVGQENPELGLAFLRVAWTATPLFVMSLYFLVVYLTDSRHRYGTLHAAVAVIGVAGAIVAGSSSLVVEQIRMIGDSVGIDYGPAMWPFLAGISATVAATAFIFYRGYPSLPAHNKLQLQYVAVGLAIFYLANLTFNILLPVAYDIVRWYWLGDYSTLAVLGLTGYAIVRRNLFGIRVLLTALLVAFIAVVLIVEALVFTVDAVFQLVKAGIVVLFLYFGYLLIQSVQREIAQREQLQDVAAELRRSNEARMEFISIVSHQLRSPLNAMKGYLALLRDGTYGALQESVRAPVERLYRSNERLIRLVNDLLGVSRIRMGTIELEWEEVDLCKVAESIVDEFGMAAEERGIRLYATCSESRLSVTGDRQKLRNSILNLVDNAIRYTDEGFVHIEVGKKAETALVTVQDTGIGIDEAEARALFESFQRGDVGRTHWGEGAGLGLYIAQQFVTLHGGKIWAESPGKGRGSTFFVQLPVTDGQRDGAGRE